MSHDLLILDCNYLCRRAQYTTGALEHNGQKTGTIFGFLRDLIRLHLGRFPNRKPIFCFDSKSSKRSVYLPTYKKDRSERVSKMSPEERAMEDEFHRQVADLRREHLVDLGFRNIAMRDGYEADDLIAHFARRVTDDQHCVIVSSDHDLFQLLAPNVEIWNPAKDFVHSIQWFQKEFGLEPSQWAKVKAIAGCHTDNVPGVSGVGEVTAAKYLRGELTKKSDAWKNIRNARQQINDNKILVELPFPGLRTIELKEDRVTLDDWGFVLNRLGCFSLKDEVPGLKKHLGR